MRGLLSWILVAVLLASGEIRAGDFRSDMDAIDAASRRNDMVVLRRLNDELAAIPTDYRHAYLLYSLSIAQQTHGQNDAAVESLDQTVELLEGLVEETPDSAEAWALLSSGYGLKIGYSPFKGPFLGPRASRALNEAMRLEPDNPRVALVKGISLYNTPRMFGGDKRESIVWLTRAIGRFAVNPGDEIRWGNPDAFIWRALAHNDFEQPGRALADLDSALAVAPDDVWAQHLREQIIAKMTDNSRVADTSGG